MLVIRILILAALFTVSVVGAALLGVLIFETLTPDPAWVVDVQLPTLGGVG